MRIYNEPLLYALTVGAVLALLPSTKALVTDRGQSSKTPKPVSCARPQCRHAFISVSTVVPISKVLRSNWLSELQVMLDSEYDSASEIAQFDHFDNGFRLGCAFRNVIPNVIRNYSRDRARECPLYFGWGIENANGMRDWTYVEGDDIGHGRRTVSMSEKLIHLNDYLAILKATGSCHGDCATIASLKKQSYELTQGALTAYRAHIFLDHFGRFGAVALIFNVGMDRISSPAEHRRAETQFSVTFIWYATQSYYVEWELDLTAGTLKRTAIIKIG